MIFQIYVKGEFLMFDWLCIVPTDEKDAEGYHIEITLATLGEIGYIGYNKSLEECAKGALPVCTCFLKNQTLKSAIEKIMTERQLQYIFVHENMSKHVYNVEKMKEWGHWKEGGNHGIQILPDCP
jgi:hypothetical protein